MEFKDKLKELRRQHHLTQDALAYQIHVSRSSIAKWEAGLGLPQTDSMEELCKYFHVSQEELISINSQEETLITKNLKIYHLNKKVLRLSIVFSFMFLLTVIVASIIIHHITIINPIDDLYTEIQLRNHVNASSELVACTGVIEMKETLLNYEYGYSYQRIDFERIKYTDQSSLVLIKVADSFTPGGIAFNMGDKRYKKMPYSMRVIQRLSLIMISM